MVRIFSIVLVLLSFSAVSQHQEIDSLKDLIRKAEYPEEKLALLNQLSDYLWHIDPDEAMIFADSAYAMIDKVDDVDLQIQAYANKGISAYTVGKYQQAEELYKKAINLAEKNNILYFDGYNYYVTSLKRQGQFLKVIELIDSLLTKAPVNDPKYADLKLSLTDALIEVGEVYRAEDILKALLVEENTEKASKYHFLYGRLLNNKGLYQLAIKRLHESLAYYEKEDDLFGQAQVFLELGEVYSSVSSFDSSAFYNENAKDVYQESGYQFGLAKANNALGALYMQLDEYELSADYYFKAADVFEDQGNLNELSTVLYNLAWLSKQQGQRNEAFDYLERSVELSEQTGNIGNEATGYNFMGLFQYDFHEYDKALENFQKAYELRERIGYKKGMSDVNFNMGLVYEKKGLYKTALEKYLESYETDKKLGAKLGIAIGENVLGHIYTKIGQFSKAEEKLNDAREKFMEIQVKTGLLNNYLYTSQYYEAVGNKDQAFDYYKHYSTLKDSIFNETKNRQFAEISARYKLNAKEREIELLNENRAQELALREQTIRNQRFLIVAIALGSLLLGVLLLLAYRILKTRKKVNQELSMLNQELNDKQEEITAQAEELREAHDQIVAINEDLENKIESRTKELLTAHEELDIFFYKSSHDFRRPLTTFLGLAELAKTTVKEPAALELFMQVKKTAEQLDEMVKKLQAISLVSMNKVEIEQVNLEELLKDVVLNYKTLAAQKQIDFRHSLNINTVYSSYPLLKSCIENLIENAIIFSKYPSANPYVFVTTNKIDGRIEVSIEDNGVGIENKYQSRIFEMFYRANERSYGNGLGLYIVKKAVERLGGSVSYKSEYKKGSAFKIYLPVEEN
ncbi:MAG: tetratricopeptide repeat protein [Candidatus Cyclobacteriaceae bacterium M2_1C_046]